MKSSSTKDYYLFLLFNLVQLGHSAAAFHSPLQQPAGMSNGDAKRHKAQETSARQRVGEVTFSAVCVETCP